MNSPFFVNFLEMIDKIVWKSKIKYYLCNVKMKQTHIPNNLDSMFNNLNLYHDENKSNDIFGVG